MNLAAEKAKDIIATDAMMGHMRGLPKKQAGFTLIELLIFTALAIILVLLFVFIYNEPR